MSLIGATQGVAKACLEALKVADQTFEVHAYTRQAPPNLPSNHINVIWHSCDLSKDVMSQSGILWISAGPIGLVLKQLEWAGNQRPQAIWALSSASTDFKLDSPSPKERKQMRAILDQEAALSSYCQANGIRLQLFKTTMLYGLDDQNINRLAELIHRLKIIPVVGQGLRAPIHVDDLGRLIADDVIAHQNGESIPSGTWRLQGGEVLTYPDLLRRIATNRGLRCGIVNLPQALLRASLSLVHFLGFLKDVNAEMLSRQARDLVVDDEPARTQLNWTPRNFQP